MSAASGQGKRQHGRPTQRRCHAFLGSCPHPPSGARSLRKTSLSCKRKSSIGHGRPSRLIGSPCSPLICGVGPRDEVERLVGYALLREEGLVRFCGYAPGRRRLRTLGAPIRSIEEIDAALHVRLCDGSQVQLPKLSLEGQRMFKRVFESMSTGADAEALRRQYAGLAPGLLATLEYKEAPQLQKWQYWVSATSMISAVAVAVAVGWKLHALLFR